MKKSILFLFLLLSVGAFAQRIVVTDSTWISNEGGNFFDNHITIYNTGEQDAGYKRLIGDTSALVQSFVSKIESKAENFATDARAVVEFPAKVKELIRQDAAIAALTGTSPVRIIQQKYQAIFTDTAWQIRNDVAALVPVVFTISGQGKLRYTIDTLPTRTAVLLGEVIRLNNFYNTTQDIELYRIRDYFYASLDRRVVLRLVGASNLNRSTTTPAPTKTTIKKQPARVKNLKPIKN